MEILVNVALPLLCGVAAGAGVVLFLARAARWVWLKLCRRSGDAPPIGKVFAPLLMILPLFVGTAVLSITGGNDREQIRNRGQIIIQALDAYHSAQKAFPENLDDLVPTYLASMPVLVGPSGPKPFFYRQEGLDDFYLEAMAESSSPLPHAPGIWSYRHSTRTWTYSD